MKATIILFSPSGNTDKMGRLLQQELERKQVVVQFVNIAGDRDYFLASDKAAYLRPKICDHSVLLIGSPVYTHHLQYHVAELITNLPSPDDRWGKIAVPFVTYGGISSGVALAEAAKLLRDTGRTVLAGMKVSCSHHMTRAFLDQEYNKDKPGDSAAEVVRDLVERIMAMNPQTCRDVSASFNYQNLMTRAKAAFLFKEKEWHQKRYPKILIDKGRCLQCGRCISVCPVCHLVQDRSGDIVEQTNTQCIHCFNCIFACAQSAIEPHGDLEKAKRFMNKMISHAAESRDICLYP